MVNAAVAIAIAVNVGANLLLLPRFGLYGAASSACASAFTLLFLMFGFARLRGMPLSVSTLWVALLPLTLLLGGMVPVALLAFVSVLIVVSPVPFSQVEKDQMRRTVMRLMRGTHP